MLSARQERRCCAVIGSPVAHSLSPAAHRAAYDALGLDWSYTAVEVDEPGLPGFLAGLTERWRGLSVTAPLKRAVVGLVDEVSPLVEVLGVANTVVLDEGGSRRADNTDGPGVCAALRQRGVRQLRSATVLGAGATAASALAGLAGLGAGSVTVLARSPDRAAALAPLGERLGLAVGVRRLSDANIPAETDAVVSTIPAAAAAPLADAVASRAALVLDAVYEPWPTPLARAAARRGRAFVSGLDLLVSQAAGQVELMTGRPAPVEAMRAAVHSRPRTAPAGPSAG